jgi:hypothetical protein
LPANGSLSDEAFHDFLSTCRDELASKQQRFWSQVESAQKWWCELETRTLAFDHRVFPITAVGTHSAEKQTWLWAWANESFPEQVCGESSRLKSLFDKTGFRVFTDPGLPASSGDAQDFAAFAVHELGAIGFYRCPSESGPTLYLAVHEQ